MKKITTKEEYFCDECGKQIYGPPCPGCGAEYCSQCWKERGTEYSGSVYNAANSIYFCHSCIANPPTKIGDLFKAHQEIKKLKDEYRLFFEQFNPRLENAERVCRKLKEEVTRER